MRQDKTRSRVTPKGTVPSGSGARSGESAGASATSSVSRTPVKVGGGRLQMLIPVLMFGLMGAGLAVILLNYVIPNGAFGTPSNWYLLGGLGLILGGIIAATQYR